MPHIEYVPKRFNAEHRAIIEHASRIIEEYAAQGYDLTLRQLYYQFVAADLIPNTMREYKRLGNIINDARMAGEIDWLAIEDRTRNLESLAHWDSPVDIIGACARQFRVDKWARQPVRPEVWVEKEAMAGIVGDVSSRNDVAYFCCRGYVSQSEQWRAGRRLRDYTRAGQRPVIIHLGDHDPSGIDMTRDVADRLSLFAEQSIEVIRIALNMDQIEQYAPPPNPAKTTDSRYADYQVRFGDDSWELDALRPQVITALIQTQIDMLRDDQLWGKAVGEEAQMRAEIAAMAGNWDDIVGDLDTTEYEGQEFDDEDEDDGDE